MLPELEPPIWGQQLVCRYRNMDHEIWLTGMTGSLAVQLDNGIMTARGGMDHRKIQLYLAPTPVPPN